jgi:hypothetical protein
LGHLADIGKPGLSPFQQRGGTPPSDLSTAASHGDHSILDTPADDVFDRIVRVAARSLDVPIAAIGFVDRDRIWFRAVHGVEGVAQVDRTAGLSPLVIRDSRAYVVPDTVDDPYVAENPLVTGKLGIRFYAAAHIATFEDLAAIVMNELELRLSALTTVRAEWDLRDTAAQPGHGGGLRGRAATLPAAAGAAPHSGHVDGRPL